MADKPLCVAYVDHTIFTTIAQTIAQDEGIAREQEAIHTLWRYHQEGRIKLVTCGKDMETDLIVWFNQQGCCVTDTLRAHSAIDEFDRWGKVQRETIRRYKQVLMFFEHVEPLPQVLNERIEPPHAPPLYTCLVNDILMEGKDERTKHNSTEDMKRILEACLDTLHMWYTEESWTDLKRTDYRLNWHILESTLTKMNRNPLFDGKEGESNRHLFGLLNRTVGLTKKSCPTLPVAKGHRDFIITMVVQKYNPCKEERHARHMYNSMAHNINLFLTTDHRLIETFNRNKHRLSDHREFAYSHFTPIRPSELKQRIG